ncbi:MAG TPA: HPF/RaiA family ribosome-associated protein [Thermomicrobiales bacterium]|jgi:ribosome-associated translation inhibitor RaiA
MRYEITNTAQGVTLTPDDHALIDDDLGRHLDPLLEAFSEDSVYLRVLVNDESGRPFTDVTLRLALPDQLLRAHESGPAFRPAFQQALRELRRQVRDYKDRNGADHSRKHRAAPPHRS